MHAVREQGRKNPKRNAATPGTQAHATKTTTQTHPVYEIVNFICSGGGANCAEKRSIPQIVHNLARRVVFPSGRVQYNELVLLGPATLQRLVHWIHTHNVPMQNTQSFTLSCAASFWLHNGMCAWGGNRESMRMVRAFKRRKDRHNLIAPNITPTRRTRQHKSPQDYDSSEPKSMALVSACTNATTSV